MIEVQCVAHCRRPAHGWHPFAAVAYWAAFSAAIAWTPALHAQQVSLPGKGHGSVSLDYQQVQVDQRTDDRGRKENLGKVDYRTAQLHLDYGFADRWAVSVGIPYGSNRATHTDHDPGIFTDPHGQHFIDNGRFHGGWKDWSIGVRYQWRTAPVRITPYVQYRFPSHDYQYYGESALGLQQSELQLGLAAGWHFPGAWQNVYLAGGAAYSYMQKKADRRVNHSTLDLDLGYFFSPRFFAHAGLSHRESYNGLDFPAALFNADGSLNQDILFHHDTVRNISFTEAHLGASYQLNDRYSLHVEGGRTMQGRNANLIKAAFGIGISRSF